MATLFLGGDNVIFETQALTMCSSSCRIGCTTEKPRLAYDSVLINYPLPKICNRAFHVLANLLPAVRVYAGLQ